MQELKTEDPAYYTHLAKMEAEYQGSPGIPGDPHADADGRELAQTYADLWNAIEEAGQWVSQEELETVDGELSGTDWVLDQGEDGAWQVHHADEDGPQQYAAAQARSPRGGITINGKRFSGGWFIPSKDMANASPEEKAAFEEAKKQADEIHSRKSQERRRRPLDVEGLRSKLSKHADQPLSKEEQRSAAASWRLYRRHHGDLAAHRVEELTKQVEAALEGIAEEHPNAEGLRNYFGRQLAKFHGMLGMEGAGGPT